MKCSRSAALGPWGGIRSAGRRRGAITAERTREGGPSGAIGGTLLNMILEPRNVPLGADVRVHRTSSDEAKTPSKAAEPRY
jgi:hypothetical protein